MKRRLAVLTSVVYAILMSFSMFFVGCFGNNNEVDTTPKEYIIQYSDDAGTHQLTVTAGMPYSIESIPVKNGYEFLGLFDAEVGGTQYVSANGSSLSAFTDGKNMVLFPQFKAVEYTVILDYQGADITGSRQYNVSYASSLPELPKNVTLEHSVFAGWYTQPNCGGVQVADKYGLVPVVSILNEKNFNLRGEYVYLYAGFETEKFTVTFCFESGMNTEDVQVEYNTPISEIVPSTRVDGKAVLTWSKTQGGEVWNGKVTEDLTLYALEYAPVIELDSNGGDAVSPVVARAGSTVSLPTPTKELAKFLYWEDMSGNEYMATTMPSASTSLKAVWQAKIVFDENGGSDVNDISVAAGNSITLPTPEKEGYIFAGWYTAEKEQYTSAKMPTAGIALKAGWYKENEKTVVLIDNNIDNKVTDDSNNLSVKKRLKIDLSEDLPNIPVSGVDMSFEITFRWGNTYKYVKGDGQIALYEGDVFSSTYQLAKKALSHDDQQEKYSSNSLKGVATIHNNILYLYYAGEGELKITLSGGYGDDVAFYDIMAKFTYPDTTNLYL